jgi:hypothetical protein
MSEADTERTVVKTYVPAYQRKEWDDHADKLDMSRSEFVKTMVQAGRRGFGTDGRERTADAGPNQDEGSAGQSPSGTDGDLEAEVLEMLAERPRGWEELLEELTAEIEDSLDETLQALQEAGEVRYSGRDGGYVLE